MAKRGKKPKPQSLHLATGTDQPCRRSESAVIPLHGEAQRPGWVMGKARKIWDRKIAVYEKRGQSIVGLEDALAHYCNLESLLIELWKTPAGPTMAMLSEYRRFCNEFFDTPASQLIRPGKKGPDNPFSKHAR